LDEKQHHQTLIWKCLKRNGVNGCEYLRGTSYRAAIGYTESPGFLENDWLLATFAAKRLQAITRYIEFVDNGEDQPAPWEHLKNQIYLGSDAYVEEQQARVASDVDLSEVPSSQ
jgi:hypothetical protein